MNAEDDIALGERAAVLLNDDTLKLAIQQIVEDCIKGWRASRSDARDERESIWRFLAATDAIVKRLTLFVDNGRMAKSKIEADRKMKEADDRIRQEAASQAGIDIKYVP